MKIIVFLVILIIVYLYILYIDRQTYNKFITGFWKADMSYCIEAEIDDMVLYLNDNTNTGYLIITKDNELIENSPFSINKHIINNKNNLTPFNNILGNQIIEYNIDFTSNDNPQNFSWNDGKYLLELSIINGTSSL